MGFVTDDLRDLADSSVDHLKSEAVAFEESLQLYLFDEEQSTALDALLPLSAWASRALEAMQEQVGPVLAQVEAPETPAHA